MSLALIYKDKKFWPLFWTQFFGALNDNVLKNALVVLVAFKGVSVLGLAPASVVALAGGLFILPYFILSPLAGQLSDKLEKSRLTVLTKYWEVAIMVIAALGFMFSSYVTLLLVLFLAGAQATLFGPVKYSMIPDLVPNEELVEANAYVELGTFLAILIGTILGGVLVTLPGGEIWVLSTLIVLSIVGLLVSLKIQKVKVACPDLKISYNPFPTIISLHRLLRESRAIYNSVLGISWFWFFGATILSILPVYVKDYLGAGEHVVTCFLAMFTIGIGLGSIFCEKLSFRRVEIGLVPLGSVGMVFFLIDLALVPAQIKSGEGLLSLSEFLAQAGGLRLFLDFFFMSVFGGFFILPLYTLIQDRSHPESRSRVIAANNIMNAVFMVAASLLVMLFHFMKLSFPQIFLTIAAIHLVVSIYIYLVVPEFTLRFLCWVMARALYRIRSRGIEFIPLRGAAVLVCNHVSYIDWLVISALSRRPVRFVMYYKFFQIPFLRYLMKQAKVIPICGRSESPEVLQKAFDQISSELQEGEIVCIFPEGTISRNGEMNAFRAGIEKIVERNPVPVVPMALNGLWGTLFSFSDGRALFKLPRRWLSEVELVITKPVPPEQASAPGLETIVRQLTVSNNSSLQSREPA